MEDICQEKARREGTAHPMGSPFSQWQIPAGGVDSDLEDGEVTLQGGEDGDLVSCCSGLQTASNRVGCWSPPQHTCGQPKVGYPED